MTDRPIIFSASMVLALLEGHKTMTRRLAWLSEVDTRKMSFICDGEKPDPDSRPAKMASVQMAGAYWLRPTPLKRAKPGDRLWVREVWSHDGPDLEAVKARMFDAMPEATYGPYYRATEVAPDTLKWITPLHMPRWASRLTLIITATKVERLQDISKADVIAEGIRYRDGSPIVGHVAGWHEPFAELWDELHGNGAWARNPEVVALSFCVEKANIDELPNKAAA